MPHYVHSSLIYNSQKLERTQISLNRGMDTENVVHLHNRVLLSYEKQWIYEILRHMDGSRGYHPKWGNPITKEHTWFALTDKQILAQKLRFLLRRGNKIPMEGVTETKCVAENEGTNTLRLPPLRVHSINNPNPRHYCRCQQELADRSMI